MIAVVSAIAPIFLLIVAGAGFRRWQFPGDGFWAPAERLSYFVLLPALIIHSLSGADLAGIGIGAVAAAVLAMGLTSGAIALLARPLLRTDGPAFTSIFQGVVRLNAYIGFAFAFTFYGPTGLAISAVFVAMMMPLANALSVMALVAFGSRGRASWSGVAVGLVTNPLILACVIGALLNPVADLLPAWLTGSLGILAQGALPIALLCVGAGLDFSSLSTQRWVILGTSVYKLALLPVLTWGIAALIGLEGVVFAIVMMFAGTPVSPSTYVMARQMGGDAGLMAGIITAQTALSVISLSALLVLIGVVAPG